MRDVIRNLRRTLLIAAVAAAAVLIGAIVLPALVGFRARVVVTGSMQPHIRVGDVVIGHSVPTTSVHVGDIVIFRDPEGSGRELTHRVIAVRSTARTVAITTKGDANTTVERFGIASTGRIALVSYRVPQVGNLFGRLHGRSARIALVTVPAIALLVIELVRIWRPGELADVGAAG
jgi:signal peptidase